MCQDAKPSNLSLSLSLQPLIFSVAIRCSGPLPPPPPNTPLKSGLSFYDFRYNFLLLHTCNVIWKLGVSENERYTWNVSYNCILAQDVTSGQVHVPL